MFASLDLLTVLIVICSISECLLSQISFHEDGKQSSFGGREAASTSTEKKLVNQTKRQTNKQTVSKQTDSQQTYIKYILGFTLLTVLVVISAISEAMSQMPITSRASGNTFVYAVWYSTTFQIRLGMSMSVILSIRC